MPMFSGVVDACSWLCQELAESCLGWEAAMAAESGAGAAEMRHGSLLVRCRRAVEWGRDMLDAVPPRTLGSLVPRPLASLTAWSSPLPENRVEPSLECG